MFNRYYTLVKKVKENDHVILFSLLGDLMERFRETRDENLIEEFNERAKPFLISAGMWEREEDEEEKENETYLELETYTTNSVKNSYSRVSHFASCLKKYQGKNKIGLGKEKLEKLKADILAYWRKEKITRKAILDYIDVFCVKCLKGNENAFFFFVTGKYVDDIKHLEKQLLEDFRLFSSVYDLIVKENGRKKFLYSQFVLFHLLKRLGHNVKEENFSLIKMEDRKKNHKEICEKIFKKLGWKF